MKTLWIILIAAVVALGGAGCKDTRRGQSNANETPVPDGSIILLKRDKEMAAVILQHQKTHPEQMDFTWFYRKDGRGTFALGDPAVSTGTNSNSTRISFATFTAAWSIHKDGAGWVYYSVGPTEIHSPVDYVMCVTSETNLAAVDANHSKWKYRSRPRVNVKALVESQVTP